jgi:hypothetical protein
MLERTRQAWRKAMRGRPSFLTFRKKQTIAEPPLGGTPRDAGVALVKGAVGVIPFAGGIIGEVIGQIIPQQRMERLEVYVRYLNEQLGTLKDDQLRPRLHDPESIELFEEGAIQSARALSDERRSHIAKLVAVGITGEAKDKIEAKRLLNLLNEIDDDQIIILAGYIDRNKRGTEFWEKHKSIVSPAFLTGASSKEEQDQRTISDLAHDDLIRLGLLRPKFRQFRAPEFDRNTGTMKPESYGLTPLGKLLLFRLELAKEGDYFF